MSAAESAVHVENGWALYAHPFFVSRLDELTVEIERAAVSDPDGFHHHPAYKLFDAVTVNILHNGLTRLVLVTVRERRLDVNFYIGSE